MGNFARDSSQRRGTWKNGLGIASTTRGREEEVGASGVVLDSFNKWTQRVEDVEAATVTRSLRPEELPRQRNGAARVASTSKKMIGAAAVGNISGLW